MQSKQRFLIIAFLGLLVFLIRSYAHMGLIAGIIATGITAIIVRALFII
jgi:hypothetical protein